MQILFQWDMRHIPVEECIQLFNESLHSESENPPRLRDDTFVESLVRGTVARQTEIDDMIRRHLQHWRLERMATVDRNILRLRDPVNARHGPHATGGHLNRGAGACPAILQ